MQNMCSKCNGYGRYSMDIYEWCASCKGLGIINIYHSLVGGGVYEPNRPCPTDCTSCMGSGTRHGTKWVDCLDCKYKS